MSINKTYAVFGLGKYGCAVAKELIENGMLAPVQQTLKLLESVYKNKDLTVVLVKETYKNAAADKKPELKKRQIIDCIKEDDRF